MIALGIDPGSERHGLAIVDMFFDNRGRTRFQTTTTGAKSTVLTTDEVIMFIRTFDYTLLAIEAPSGYIHQKQRTKHLLSTARHAGAFAQCARERGKRVTEISAEHVRTFVARNPHASDKELKTALSVFINLPTRSNAHTRDATAVAVVGLLQEPKFKPVKPV